MEILTEEKFIELGFSKNKDHYGSGSYYTVEINGTEYNFVENIFTKPNATYTLCWCDNWRGGWDEISRSFSDVETLKAIILALTGKQL